MTVAELGGRASARDRLRRIALEGRLRSTPVVYDAADGGAEGITFEVRELTARQRAAIEALWNDGKTAEVRPYLLAECVTVDGERVFADGDGWIQDLPHALLEQLFEAGLRISGIWSGDDDAEADEAKK